MTSPTYDPTGRPVEPGVEQPDPRVGEAVRPGTFAESDLEYATTEGGRERYGEPADAGTSSSSTVETAKSEAANVKDTVAEAAAGVKEVAMSEVSNVAEEAKYQTRNLLDQTRSELRGQASNQQSALAAMVKEWASEIGAMASKSEESGPMTDLAYKASHRGREIANWLDTHEPGDLLEEVKRFARRRPFAFLALAAAAGVVVGRLTRGAVAANTSTEPTPARAYDSDIYGDYAGAAPASGGYGTRGYQDGGYDPRYAESFPSGSQGDLGAAATGQYSAPGTEAPGQSSAAGAADAEQPPATGTAYPDITPTTDESYYPPPAEGEVRR